MTSSTTTATVLEHVTTNVAEESRSSSSEQEVQEAEAAVEPSENKQQQIIASLKAKGKTKDWAQMLTDIRQARGTVPPKQSNPEDPKPKDTPDFVRVMVHHAIRLVQNEAEQQPTERLYLNSVTTRRARPQEKCYSQRISKGIPIKEASESQRLLKVVQLDAQEESLIITLLWQYNDQGKNKTVSLRALIDSGATLSCISSRILAKQTNMLRPYRAEVDNVEVAFANGETTKTSQAFNDVTMTEETSKTDVRFGRLYELPLPKGIDMVLGMDWLRETNPNIDWKNNTMDLGFKPRKLHRAKKELNLVSLKHMRQMSRIDPGQVFRMTVRDTRVSKNARLERLNNLMTPPTSSTPTRESTEEPDKQKLKRHQLNRVRMNKSSARSKVEALLEPVEHKPEVPKDAHDNGKPKLFLDQPETGLKTIDAALINGKDRFVMELTEELVQK